MLNYMSMDYVESRIHEALKQSQGNTTRARQLIINWTHDDSRLLQGLTRAHLNGIVAYNIDRVLSGRSAQKGGKPTEPLPPAEKFGMEILKAVVNSGAVFGLEAGDAPRKARQASQQHIDAIRALAAKNKKP